MSRVKQELQKSQAQKIVGLVLIAIVLAGLGLGLVGSQYQLSYFQSLQPSFVAFDVAPVGMTQRFRYTESNQHEAFPCQFGPTMNLDPDGAYTDPTFNLLGDEHWMPNILGEVSETFLVQPAQYAEFGIDSNPYRTVEWEITETGGSTVYKIEEWIGVMYLVVNTKPDMPVQSPRIHSFWEYFNQHQEIDGNFGYEDAVLWLRVKLQNDWTFEGIPALEVGIAGVYVHAVQLSHTDMDVTPGSYGLNVPMYQSVDGVSVQPQDPTEYEGSTQVYLDDEVFLKFGVNQIGITSYWQVVPPLTGLDGYHVYESQVITWILTVKMFVLGEWFIPAHQTDPFIPKNGSHLNPLPWSPIEWLFIASVIIIIGILCVVASYFKSREKVKRR